jgi:hypothetical protein
LASLAPLPEGKSIMLRPADTYADMVAAFRWEIPARYNIGVDVADKHVRDERGDQLALIYESESGAVERFSFACKPPGMIKLRLVKKE